MLFGLWKGCFPKKLVLLSFCGLTHSGVMVFARKSISGAPNCYRCVPVHLCIGNFSPASLIHSKVESFLQVCDEVVGAVGCDADIATYRAHWSAFITRSKESLMKLKKADKALLSPCVNPLEAKLKARLSMDRWSAIWRQWYACEQSSLQKNVSLAMCCSLSVRVLTGCSLLI